MTNENKLTHLDNSGHAQMVNIADKDVSAREAIASASVIMKRDTLQLILTGGHKKGDVFAVARIAGIQAAKKTSDLIPLCHPLALTSVNIDISADEERSVVNIQCRCKVDGKTGVEMEALTGASVAALTLYDMCKAVDRGMTISDINVDSKSGGKSGDWSRSKQ